MPDTTVVTPAFFVRRDGSFDITAGELRITGCYPSIDGQAARVVRFTIEHAAGTEKLRYELAHGALELTLSHDDAGVVIRSRVSGIKALPYRISPIGGAMVQGADRFYRLGLGIADKSGFRAMPVDKPTDAHGLCAFVAPNGHVLVVSVRDFRNFHSKTMLVPRVSDIEPARLDVGFQTENVPVESHDGIDLPPIYITADNNAWSALRVAAQASAQEMGARTDKPTTYHWCSWYYQYYHLDMPTLNAYVDGFAALPDKAGIQAIQIDAGYFPHAGDWLEPNHRFPNGLAPVFSKIASAGFVPGIWIGPYMVGSRSKLYREHPDWILRRTDGQPVKEWLHYNENRVWGLLDEEHYVLDTSHPAAMEYLRTVFATLYRWGARFFKTDFILWGYIDSSTVRRHTPGKTSQQYAREMFDMIREEIGDESYWLGCIAPYTPMVGYVDGMRVGGDISAARGSAREVYRETIGCQPINNVWWQNDPDAMVIRARHTHKSPAEARSDAMWFGMLGGAVNTSDALHEEPADRLALWRFLEPGPKKWTATFPAFDQLRKVDNTFGEPPEFFVMVRAFPDLGAWAILLLNEQERVLKDHFRLSDLIGQAHGFVFKWDPEGHQRLGERSELFVDAEPRSSVLLYVSGRDEPPPSGLTLGGNLRA